MNRSGNTGFNGLVFFGNRGDGLFLLEGRGCGGEGILVSFIPASNEPSGHACMSIWRLPQGSLTAQSALV